MKRELVCSLRTVCFLAMFSQDSTTVANIQGALKSMSVLEPDLILPSILERAGPALEALVEVSLSLVSGKSWVVYIFADTTNHCCHQSPGRGGTSFGMQRDLLSWGEASTAHIGITSPGD